MGVGRILPFVLVVGCYTAPPMGVEGDIQSRGGDLGDWDLHPAICLTGEPVGFEGIDLSSEDGQHCVRFVDDPFQGPTVVGYIPGTDQGREFLPRDCNEFFVRIERTKDQTGAIYNVGGVMTIDCQTDDGSLVGDLAFDGCW
jgi:hypothetical protein